MDAPSRRVLRLFRLSVPPLFLVLACYVFLGEHVFGLAYVIGNRLKPRMRATLPGVYRLGTALVAFVMHASVWFACADYDGEPSLCPPTYFGERYCLLITSVSALYCGATLLVERWANPMFVLRQPTGLRARACAVAQNQRLKRQVSQLRHTVTTLRISKVASNDSGGERHLSLLLVR